MSYNLNVKRPLELRYIVILYYIMRDDVLYIKSKISKWIFEKKKWYEKPPRAQNVYLFENHQADRYSNIEI